MDKIRKRYVKQRDTFMFMNDLFHGAWTFLRS
jgi:hypothetical protein